MAQSDRQTEVMRQYLLGALSEAEQEALETAYLGDDDAFEEMVRVENQLVDHYVQGRLAPADRLRFEQHYLAHPDRRERVQFAAALQKKIQQERQAEAVRQPQAESESLWQKLLALFRGNQFGMIGTLAAAVVVLVVGLRFFYQYVRPLQINDPDIATVSPPPRLETPSPILPPGNSPPPNTSPTKGNGSPKPVDTATPILPPDQTQRPDLAQPSVRAARAFLLLTPGVAAPNATKLELTKETREVRLQLNLDQQTYDTYRATIRNSSGQDVLERQTAQVRRTNDGIAIIVQLPANRLAAGTYQVLLSGVNDKGDATEVTQSFFRVEKK